MSGLKIPVWQDLNFTLAFTFSDYPNTNSLKQANNAITKRSNFGNIQFYSVLFFIINPKVNPHLQIEMPAYAFIILISLILNIAPLTWEQWCIEVPLILKTDLRKPNSSGTKLLITKVTWICQKNYKKLLDFVQSSHYSTFHMGNRFSKWSHLSSIVC